MWSQFEICPDLLKLIRRDGNVKDSFPPKLVFALDPHLWDITDVAMITAIIFNLSPSAFSLANYRALQMNKTTDSVPVHFWCHAPHLDEMSRRGVGGVTFLCEAFSSRLESHWWESPHRPHAHVRLVVQRQLHQPSVMPRWSALSDRWGYLLRPFADDVPLFIYFRSVLRGRSVAVGARGWGWGE